MSRLSAVGFVALSLVMSGPVSAGEPEPLSSPLFTIPFDEAEESTLQIELSQQVRLFMNNLQSHWGHNQMVVETAVTGTIRHNETGKLIFLRHVSDHAVLEGYEFRQESLVRGQYVLLQRPLNGLNEFIGYYEAVKVTLTKAYGKPADDRIVWDNDLYQAVPDYWGVAVLIGHLHYHAAWETRDGTLTVALTGDRHSKLTIDYRSKNHVESEHFTRL